MATSDDVILIFGAQDDITPVLQSIDSNIQNMNNNLVKFGKEGKDSMGGLGKGAKDAEGTFSSFWQSAKSGASDFMSSMQGMSGMVAGILGGIGVTSVWDKIFGTGMKVETNKIIVENLTESKNAAEELYNVVDEATNVALMSMQDVIPAMNAFKSSTGANTEELKIAADVMASFGSQVLLLTDSEQLANTAMYDLSKGLDNSFLTLRRYGVTKESLLATGKWKGEKKDIKGYLEAVKEVAGLDPRMMQTTQGVITNIGKQFSVSGKKLSQDLLPYLKSAVVWFYDLDKAAGGNVSKGILVTVGALGSLLAVGYGISSLWPLLKTGAGLFSGTLSILNAKAIALTASTLSHNLASANLTGTMVAEAAAHASSATSAGLHGVANTAAIAPTWGLTTAVKALGIAMLTNPVTLLVGGIIALVGTIIYLKTQTDLLTTTQEKSNAELDKSQKHIDDLNQKQQKSSERVLQLKENLAKLTPGTNEYKKALKELNDEESKNSKYQDEIASATEREAEARRKLEKATAAEAEATKKLAVSVVQYKVATGEISVSEGQAKIADMQSFENTEKLAEQRYKNAQGMNEKSEELDKDTEKLKSNINLNLQKRIENDIIVGQEEIIHGDFWENIMGFLRLKNAEDAKKFAGYGDGGLGDFFNPKLNSTRMTDVTASGGMKVIDSDGKKAQTTVDKLNKTVINPKTNSTSINNLKNNTKNAKSEIDKTDGSNIDIGVTGISLLQDAYNWGKKLYCIINGCSPGIIPALKRLSTQVKNGDYDIGSRVTLPDPTNLDSRLNQMKKSINRYGVSNSDLKLLGSKVNNSNTKSLTKQYIIKDGAFTIDARNKTQKEAQKLLNLALDGLDNSKSKGIDN